MSRYPLLSTLLSKRYILLYIVAISLIIISLSFVRYGLMLRLPGLIIIMSIFLLFGDIEYKIIIIAICLPFSHLLKINPQDSSIVPVLYLFLLIMLLKKKPRINFISILFLIATLTSLSLNLDVSVTEYIKFSIYMVVILLLCSSYANTNYRLIFPYLIVFSISLLLSNTLSFIAPEILINASWYNGITISTGSIELLRRTGLMYDPNFQGQAIALSVSMIICNIESSKYKKTLLSIVFILLLFGYTTLSKSYFISSFFIWIQLILVLFTDTSRRSRRSFSSLFYIFILIFFVLFSILLFWQEVSLMYGAFWRAMSSRFYVSDFSTGRFDIQGIYLEKLGNSRLINILFGYGLGINEKLMRITGTHIAPHNSFLESFSYLGIFGTVFLIVFLMSCYVNIGSKKNNSPNQSYQKILLLAILLVYLLSLDMLLINLSVFYTFLLFITFRVAR